MKVMVACLTLNSLGGAERLCVRFLRSLEKIGCDMTLATIERTDWTLLKKLADVPSKPPKEVFLFKKMPNLPTLTLRQAFPALLHLFQLFQISMRGGYDLLVNMRGEVVDSLGDVVYFNAMPLRLMHVYPQIQPAQGVNWRVYSRLFSLLTEAFRRPQKVVIANSKFNKQIISRHLGKRAVVVYPPVELKNLKAEFEDSKREDLVVTISRFRPAKGLELVPEIAKLTPACKFDIIGTSDRNSDKCIAQIFKRARVLGVQDRVEIFENKPFSFTHEKLLRAKAFLHTQTTEAFGMAIVEAMAAGCVPVVPRYGGPWFDILDGTDGMYGFSYDSAGEAAEKIELLLKRDDMREEISDRTRKRAKAFAASVFDEKMSRIIERLAS